MIVESHDEFAAPKREFQIRSVAPETADEYEIAPLYHFELRTLLQQP